MYKQGKPTKEIQRSETLMHDTQDIFTQGGLDI